MTDNIQILTGLTHIRQAPSMYVGDTTTPDTLLKEAVDNALDEMLNGYAKRIEIDYSYKEGWFRVRDDARGLPLSKFKSDNPELKSANGEISAKLLFIKKDSSGKFDKKNYEYSGGLHGLGITICNALSTKTLVRVKDKKNLHEGKMYVLELGWKNLTQTSKEKFIDDPGEWFSTEVTIYPDLNIFKTINAKINETQLKLARSLKPDCEIYVNGKLIEPFSFRQSIDDNLLEDKLFELNFKYNTIKFDIEFGWSNKSFITISKGSVNLMPCQEGWHIKEFNQALGRALVQINPSLNISDAEIGLRSFNRSLISLPKFSSQIKEKLTQVKDFEQNNLNAIKNIINKANLDETQKLDDRDLLIKYKQFLIDEKKWQDSNTFGESLTKELLRLLKSENEFTEKLIGRLIEYKKSMEQLSDEAYINSLIKTGSDKIARNAVKGVAEATSLDRTKCCIYIAEGSSAGGPLKSYRNRNFQAVFELRGKILNVVKTEFIQEILENKEIRNFINSLGVGLTPNVKMEDARYSKIIMCTDADHDGLHIQGLIIGALIYLVPEVFVSAEDGKSMLYAVKAPLYKQDNKFIYDKTLLLANKPVKRYKGIGSMQKEDVESSLLNENTRLLKRINLPGGREQALKLIGSSYEKKKLLMELGLIIED